MSSFTSNNLILPIITREGRDENNRIWFKKRHESLFFFKDDVSLASVLASTTKRGCGGNIPLVVHRE